MPKKLFAITNIKFATQNEEHFFTAGEVVDHSKFTKEQLESLVDSGAAEVREADEEAEKVAPTTEDLNSDVRPTGPVEDETMKVPDSE